MRKNETTSYADVSNVLETKVYDSIHETIRTTYLMCALSDTDALKRNLGIVKKNMVDFFDAQAEAYIKVLEARVSY